MDTRPLRIVLVTMCETARPADSVAAVTTVSSTVMTDQAALGTRVLVVDDEPQVVWVLQFSLEAEGYTTFAARNGVQAMNAIAEHHPQVMLLDIMMPTMDGWSVLEEMMQLPREERPRVVVVSAMSNLRDRAKAAEMGADAFMPKPFDVDDLLVVLQGLEKAS
jgi:two-component system, OmpR family, KDP operon response regulator KdpE